MTLQQLLNQMIRYTCTNLVHICAFASEAAASFVDLKHVGKSNNTYRRNYLLDF